MKGLNIASSIIIFIVFTLFSLTIGSESFDAFRSLQLTKDGNNLGSHKSSLNHHATSFQNAFNPDLSRSKVIIIPYKEFIIRTERYRNGTYPDNLLATLGVFQQTIAGGASGVVVVVPKSIDRNEISRWRAAEHSLLENELLIPLYFIYEQPGLDIILENLEKTSIESTTAGPLDFILSDHYQIIVPGKEGSAIKQTQATNIQGWLAGGGDSSNSPTIAIFAHYDALSSASKLAYSADASISGTVTVLELARLFSRLYNNPRTQSKYNILFVLTSAGELNYQGSKHWLTEVDERSAKSIEFALCLDSVSSDDNSAELYLHTSRPPKDPVAKRIYDTFSKTAAHLDRSFQVLQHKVNFSNTEEPWEHEHFSKVKILASTLSSNQESLPLLGRSHIFDTRERINIKNLKDNIRFIGESLAKFVFSIEGDNLEIFHNAFEVDELFLSSWVETLGNQSRFLPHISESLVEGLERTLKTYTTEVSNQTFTFDKNFGYQFYSPSEDLQLTAYVVKPFVFDVVLAAIIFSYLGALYFVIKFLRPILQF